MGTHPIFESDFDCLTDLIRLRKMHFSFQGKSFNAENTDEVLSLFTEESYAVVNGRVIQPGFSLEEYGLTEGFQVEEVPRMLGGKVHGSLARAGKVKGQTPKVDAEEKKKAKTGRAKRRMQYNRRFVNVVPSFGKTLPSSPTSPPPSTPPLSPPPPPPPP